MSQQSQSPYVHYDKNGNKAIRNPNSKGTCMKYIKAGKIKEKLKFQHKAVNDENQDLCNGWFTHDPIPFEECDRVVQGLKPVGISHYFIKEEVDAKEKEYKEKGFLVSTSSRDGKTYNITVSVDGKLKDYFDMKTLANDYALNKLLNDSEIIKSYEDTNFEAFHNNKYDHHPTCIVGLILGYPIENTISMEKHRY